ncbi:LysR family transcriptional regulator, partial [Streptomyces broussonetiae]|uniref:LysR family transcriptional regulator n=1 Tax=Streptomyces broussonetiae TaxID=2686304 RepID=UPI0035D8FE97
MDFSSTALRVLRQVAESGSFTAAASRLGYTQSAVSRQAAALERSAGAVLFERRFDGVQLTPAGLTLLRHARVILDSIAVVEHELADSAARTEPVRLGMFPSAGASILPGVLTRLATAGPQVTVTTREGTTPGLLRALRAGSIDIAVLTSRPPHRPSDGESPRLHIETVGDTELLVGAA